MQPRPIFQSFGATHVDLHWTDEERQAAIMAIILARALRKGICLAGQTCSARHIWMLNTPGTGVTLRVAPRGPLCTATLHLGSSIQHACQLVAGATHLPIKIERHPFLPARSGAPCHLTRGCQRPAATGRLSSAPGPSGTPATSARSCTLFTIAECA